LNGLFEGVRHRFESVIAIGAMVLLAITAGCKSSPRRSVAPPLREAAANPAVTAASYDKAMIKAIQVRWLQLLDERGYGGGVKGRMVVEFNQRSDGGVSDISVLESDLPAAFAQLCQAAIRDVAPFAAWPDDLRQQIGKDERVVRFNFAF
jgi:outer membrane biosynthesis protein TonB